MQNLIQTLNASGIPKIQIIWALRECWETIQENEPTDPDAQFQYFLYYWATEFQWCSDNPIWESDYSELEYHIIQNILNTFPESQKYRQSLMLNFN